MEQQLKDYYDEQLINLLVMYIKTFGMVEVYRILERAEKSIGELNNDASEI